MAEADEIEVQDRGQFGSRIGFLMAAIGSAVGFGSIARFPVNVANEGGAIFVLIYIVMMVLIGIPLMVSEFSLGRAAGKNPVGAFGTLSGDINTRWRLAGILFVLIATFFLSWYSIIAGWTLKYLFGSITGAYFSNPGDYFAGTAEGPETLLWHLVVMIMVVSAVAFQISKGIEKVNLVFMPALFLMIFGLAVYAITLPNSGPGYAFYLQPDFGAISFSVIRGAVGQAFFSLSLGIGAMLVYASYLSKGTSLASNAGVISFSTLGFAIMCGFMVFPMLSAFGQLDGQTASGLGLIFGPLPQVFAEMGGATGRIVGTAFFLATFFAAFSSAIALTEPAISYLVEEWNIDRKRAAVLTGGIIYTAGIAVAFSTDLLNLEGGIITDTLVIVGGLLIALYVGWSTPRREAMARMDQSDSGLRVAKYAYPIVKWAMPPLLVILLLFQTLVSFGVNEFLGICLISDCSGPGT